MAESDTTDTPEIEEENTSYYSIEKTHTVVHTESIEYKVRRKEMSGHGKDKTNIPSSDQKQEASEKELSPRHFTDGSEKALKELDSLPENSIYGPPDKNSEENPKSVPVTPPLPGANYTHFPIELLKEAVLGDQSESKKWQAIGWQQEAPDLDKTPVKPKKLVTPHPPRIQDNPQSNPQVQFCEDQKPATGVQGLEAVKGQVHETPVHQTSIATSDHGPIPNEQRPMTYTQQKAKTQGQIAAGDQRLAPTVDRKPADTGDRKPAGPGDQKPAGPGDRKPADTGDRKPAGPGDRNPADTGDRKPAGPGDRKPADTGDRKPAGPGDQKPAGPGDRKPAGPGDRKPADTEDQKPAGPGDQKPAGPGDQKPAGPGDRKPAGPGDRKPADAGDQKPTGPGDQKPAGPGDRKPADAGDQKPADAGDQKPAGPGDQQLEYQKPEDTGDQGLPVETGDGTYYLDLEGCKMKLSDMRGMYIRHTSSKEEYTTEVYGPGREPYQSTEKTKNKE